MQVQRCNGTLRKTKNLAAKPTHHSKQTRVKAQRRNMVKLGQEERETDGAEVFGGMGSKGHM